jgi:hypothetical protein
MVMERESGSGGQGDAGQALPAGTRVEEFEVVRVLGSGGFGVTYLAKDLRLGRKVVLKENLPVQFAYRDMGTLTVRPRHTTARDAEDFRWALENFEKEAGMLASLDHPGIVKVLRSFEANGTAYFVMPFVEGQALDEVLRDRENGRLGNEEALLVLWRMLDALEYLHARGIYHRDIKPGNILMTGGGEPVLIDFGAARQRLGERSMTVLESPGYTPFEQLQSRGDVGPWSDLYALGATLYKAITGETPAKVADRMLDDPVVPLAGRAERAGLYSGSLRASVDRAMAVRVEGRYRDAAEWRAAVWGDEQGGGEVEGRQGALEDRASGGEWGGKAEETLEEVVIGAAKEAGRGRTSERGGGRRSAVRRETAQVAAVGAGGRGVVRGERAAGGGGTAVGQGGRRKGKGGVLPLVGVLMLLVAVVGGAVLLVQVTERAEDQKRAELARQVEEARQAEVVDRERQALEAERERLAEARLAEAEKRRAEEARPGAGLRAASKESPFVNGLGMRFVPVPGTDVLMSVWETRVRDYAAYAAENPGVDMGWKDVIFGGNAQGSDHPVVKVSWEDAKAFCAWLTRTERAAGRIGEGDEYRLPTDHEWSMAVGIGEREDPALSPSEKHGKIEDVYPWGRQWPPPGGAGNYHGEEGAATLPKIEGYRDEHPFTAPVGSYRVNGLGLYDLGGNVWEWCEDRWSLSWSGRVLRGGSWGVNAEVFLRSSFRDDVHPTLRHVNYGFRVVVVAVGGGG